MYAIKFHCILVALVSLLACGKESIVTERVLKETENVNFSDLQPGQVTNYIRFEYTCPEHKLITFSVDTLTIEIQLFDDGYYIKEYRKFNSFILGNYSESIYRIDNFGGKISLPPGIDSQLFGSQTKCLQLESRNVIKLYRDECGFYFESGKPSAEYDVPDEIPGFFEELTFDTVTLKNVSLSAHALENPFNRFWTVYNKNGILIRQDDFRHDGSVRNFNSGWIQTDLVE